MAGHLRKQIRHAAVADLDQPAQAWQSVKAARRYRLPSAITAALAVYTSLELVEVERGGRAPKRSQLRVPQLVVEVHCRAGSLVVDDQVDDMAEAVETLLVAASNDAGSAIKPLIKDLRLISTEFDSDDSGELVYVLARLTFESDYGTREDDPSAPI